MGYRSKVIIILDYNHTMYTMLITHHYDFSRYPISVKESKSITGKRQDSRVGPKVKYKSVGKSNLRRTDTGKESEKEQKLLFMCKIWSVDIPVLNRVPEIQTFDT